MVKNLPANGGDVDSIPDLGTSPGGMHRTPPVFLPGESPWTGVPDRLWSMGLQRVRHDWATKHSSAQSIVHGLQGGTSGKESTCQSGDVRDADSISELERFPGGRHGRHCRMPSWFLPSSIPNFYLKYGSSETVYHRLELEPTWLGLKPSKNSAWYLNPRGWDSNPVKTLLWTWTHVAGTQTLPKSMVPGFRT